jgi:hypothetical protein
MPYTCEIKFTGDAEWRHGDFAERPTWAEDQKDAANLAAYKDVKNVRIVDVVDPERELRECAYCDQPIDADRDTTEYSYVMGESVHSDCLVDAGEIG